LASFFERTAFEIAIHLANTSTIAMEGLLRRFAPSAFKPAAPRVSVLEATEATNASTYDDDDDDASDIT
jgi:hypothetical protein